MSNEEPVDTQTRNEVQRQVKTMRDEDIVQLIRDAVVHLEVLVDRLDAIADKKEGDGAGKHTAGGH